MGVRLVCRHVVPVSSQLIITVMNTKLNIQSSILLPNSHAQLIINPTNIYNYNNKY